MIAIKTNPGVTIPGPGVPFLASGNVCFVDGCYHSVEPFCGRVEFTADGLLIWATSRMSVAVDVSDNIVIHEARPTTGKWPLVTMRIASEWTEQDFHGGDE
jgi:hypothetical protein